MLTALRSAVLIIGFCVLVAVAACWLCDLGEPAPPHPPDGIYVPHPCFDCHGLRNSQETT
jgi:hypothetical protein